MVTIPTRLVRNRLDGPRHQNVAGGPNSGRLRYDRSRFFEYVRSSA